MMIHPKNARHRFLLSRSKILCRSLPYDELTGESYVAHHLALFFVFISIVFVPPTPIVAGKNVIFLFIYMDVEFTFALGHQYPFSFFCIRFARAVALIRIDR